ncbi:uncharacterized protein I303_102866 [Kwoniella dejecticola CBS 10117]|uniref:Uncharacterized protein n=1 Tax=Kwoniella dejecticola CBS 10117 TaxID=1296121 RepID=A0A1A6A9X9_9TREE|nr:uncharacterized protein I303_02884 [Kwoniella dejecticola CBS 10117]OBR86865.1 hypothetical protein I303_02884 [Kwoniella dejecticola CBS 10117]
MSGGIGLGLGSFPLDKSSSSITYDGANSDTGTNKFSSRSTHPAYSVLIPERLPRGPRSLGVGKRFVSAPSHTLSPTIYDKTSTNPLYIPPTSSNTPNANQGSGVIPVNSPQLDLDLVNINPTQHLMRQMKKRSLDRRNFGLSSNDPLNRMNQPVVIASSSPTTTSSPTLAASSSPIIPSSPVIPSSASETTQPPSQSHHVDLLGPSIALSVVLGLLVLGVAGWMGIHYRRKRLNDQNVNGMYGKRRERDSDEKSFTSEMFNASNVVEKGLKPRSKSSSNATGRLDEQDDDDENDHAELRWSFISYKRPPGAPSANGSRRVSFVDTVQQQISSTTEEERYYAEDGASQRRHSTLPPPRFMVAALHQPEAQSEVHYVLEPEDSEEEEVEVEHEVPAPSPRSSIAPTLEMIEEEAEEESLGSIAIDQPTLNDQSTQQKTVYADRYPLEVEVEVEVEESNRQSVVSDTSSSGSSHSSTCSADYTTASARSSISSLSALSIISSSFPQTPRDPSTPPPQDMELDMLDHSRCSTSTSTDSPDLATGVGTGGTYDSPTPSSKFQSRRKRAQSQGHPSSSLVEIKKDDLLRTAVGRTMSLQPTKDVREFIKLMMVNQGEVAPLPLPVSPIGVPIISEGAAGAVVMSSPKQDNEEAHSPRKQRQSRSMINSMAEDSARQKVDAQQKQQRPDLEEMEDLRMAAFISSQLEEKVTKDLNRQQSVREIHRGTTTTKSRSKMGRSTSVPAKLLQRNKSTSTSESMKNYKDQDKENRADRPNQANGLVRKKNRQSEILTATTANTRARKGSNEDADRVVITNIPISPKRSTYTGDENETETTGMDLLAQRQLQLERYLSLLQAEAEAAAHAGAVAESHEADQEHSHDNDRTTTSANPSNVNTGYQEKGEEEDMEIEVQEVDSIRDPEIYQHQGYEDESEYEYEYEYQYGNEDEDGIPFEEYYIHFEDEDGDHGDYDNDNDNDCDNTNENEDPQYSHEIKGHGVHEEQQQQQERYEDERKGRRSHVPHIRVTSH